MTHHQLKQILYIVGTIGLLAAVAGFYYMMHSASPAGGWVPVAGQTVPSVSAPQRQPPVGYYEYRNVQYHFSIFCPDGLTVKEYDEGGGASTITFQNVAAAQGFQVFVRPYGSTQITPTEFLKDEPSGVRKGAKDIHIGGVLAQSFYSTDPALGDTAEIWFIYGGYLYEVTTLKSLAPWLSESMQTWMFI